MESGVAPRVEMMPVTGQQRRCLPTQGCAPCNLAPQINQSRPQFWPLRLAPSLLPRLRFPAPPLLPTPLQHRPLTSQPPLPSSPHTPHTPHLAIQFSTTSSVTASKLAPCCSAYSLMPSTLLWFSRRYLVGWEGWM